MKTTKIKNYILTTSVLSILLAVGLSISGYNALQGDRDNLSNTNPYETNIRSIQGRVATVRPDGIFIETIDGNGWEVNRESLYNFNKIVDNIVIIRYDDCNTETVYDDMIMDIMNKEN